MNRFSIAGGLLLTILFSCTDPGLIGLEVQPEGDKIIISTYDEGAVMSLESIEEDSIRTDQNKLSLLGAYSDDFFGRSIAGFSTQLLLLEEDVEVGNNPTLDSAVLTIAYSGYYGDTSSMMSIGVYELSEDIYLDSAYYSDQNFSGNLLSELDFYPRPNTNILLSEDSIGAPMLRVPMNDLGNKILTDPLYDLSSNKGFLSSFKGLMLKPLEGNNSSAIVYLDLINNRSKLTIYYNDTSSIELVMGSSAARINHFDTEHALDLSLNGVQSMGGYNTKLSFNNLDTIKALLETKPINIATLTFNVHDKKTFEYLPHNKLALVRVNSDGNKFFLPDYFEGDAHFGGVLRNDEQYIFNVTKYLQQLVNGDILESELYLMPSGGAITANRTLIDENVFLEISYTEF